jgi:hypothetical protein
MLGKDFRLVINGKSQAKTTTFDLYGFIWGYGKLNPAKSGLK